MSAHIVRTCSPQQEHTSTALALVDPLPHPRRHDIPTFVVPPEPAAIAALPASETAYRRRHALQWLRTASRSRLAYSGRLHGLVLNELRTRGMETLPYTHGAALKRQLQDANSRLNAARAVLLHADLETNAVGVRALAQRTSKGAALVRRAELGVWQFATQAQRVVAHMATQPAPSSVVSGAAVPAAVVAQQNGGGGGGGHTTQHLRHASSQRDLMRTSSMTKLARDVSPIRCVLGVWLWLAGCGCVAVWLWLWLFGCGFVAVWLCLAVCGCVWLCVAVAVWLSKLTCVSCGNPP